MWKPPYKINYIAKGQTNNVWGMAIAQSAMCTRQVGKIITGAVDKSAH